MAYDRAGNPRYVQDNVLSASDGSGAMVRSFDRLPSYDGLGRLTGLAEGELDLSASSPAISSGTASRGQLLARNLAGRILHDRVDLDGNGVYTNGPNTAAQLGEMDDQRTYNRRNELLSRQIFDSVTTTAPRQTVTLTYDRNGNLRSDGERHTYLFDAWGRLVEIGDYAAEAATVARFTYSGLSHRISEQTDTSSLLYPGYPDGQVDGDDSVFYISTDPQGRRVGTYREGDQHPKETLVWTPAGIGGLSGVFGATALYRDRDADLKNPAVWEIGAGPETRGQRHFYCSDARGSAVTLLGLRSGHDGPTGTHAEQYRYSATGVPFGIPLGDAKVDGEVEEADYQTVGIVALNVYEIRADLHLDGLVTYSEDVALVAANMGTVVGRGGLSAESVSNRVGLRSDTMMLSVGPLWIHSLLDARISTRIATSRFAAISLGLPSQINDTNDPCASERQKYESAKDDYINHMQTLALSPFSWPAFVNEAERLRNIADAMRNLLNQCERENRQPITPRTPTDPGLPPFKPRPTPVPDSGSPGDGGASPCPLDEGPPPDQTEPGMDRCATQRRMNEHRCMSCEGGTRLVRECFERARLIDQLCGVNQPELIPLPDTALPVRRILVPGWDGVIPNRGPTYPTEPAIPRGPAVPGELVPVPINWNAREAA